MSRNAVVASVAQREFVHKLLDQNEFDLFRCSGFHIALAQRSGCTDLPAHGMLVDTWIAGLSPRDASRLIGELK